MCATHHRPAEPESVGTWPDPYPCGQDYLSDLCVRLCGQTVMSSGTKVRSFVDAAQGVREKKGRLA